MPTPPALTVQRVKRWTVLALVLALAAGLSGCSAKRMEAGLFRLSQTGVGSNDLGAHAALPHLAVAVTPSEVTTTVKAGAAQVMGLGREELQTAEGEELIIATLLVAQPDFRGGRPAAVVHAGDGQHDVTDRLRRRDITAVPGMIQSYRVLASVPVGSSAFLRVSDEGRSVDIDLRTGALGGDLRVTRTAVPPTPAVGGSLKSSGVVGPRNPQRWPAAFRKPSRVALTLDFSHATARRMDWFDGHGWAADGTTYLWISGIRGYSLPAPLCPSSWTLTGRVSLVARSGEPIRPVLLSPQSIRLAEQRALGMLFRVPAGPLSGSLTVAPLYRVTGTSCTVLTQPSRVTQRIALP